MAFDGRQLDHYFGSREESKRERIKREKRRKKCAEEFARQLQTGTVLMWVPSSEFTYISPGHLEALRPAEGEVH